MAVQASHGPWVKPPAMLCAVRERVAAAGGVGPRSSACRPPRRVAGPPFRDPATDNANSRWVLQYLDTIGVRELGMFAIHSRPGASCKTCAPEYPRGPTRSTGVVVALAAPAAAIWSGVATLSIKSVCYCPRYKVHAARSQYSYRNYRRLFSLQVCMKAGS